MNEFKRYNWEEYEKMLVSYGYTTEQISAVKEIRENPEAELMTPEQFRYLFMAGILKRTRKLRKLRSLIVLNDKVWYLEHYLRKYCYCAEFVNTEE